MTGSAGPPSFRLAYVPGVMPGKWVGVWRERLPGVPLSLEQVEAADAADVLLGRAADVGLVRLPVDRTVLSAIPLYTETTVVVVPRDHVFTAVDEVTADDMADEIVLNPLDDVLGWRPSPGLPARERPATTEDAVRLVAAGIGVLVVPLSLARLHHRRDLAHVPVADAPRSEVALSWPEDGHTDLVEEFIGIVRGRTVNSTRGRGRTPGARDAERATPRRDSRAGGGSAGSPTGGRPSGRDPRRGSGAGGSRGRGRPRRRS
ncbi:LysR substrate-binding domain-containing protein [Streptomyces sp. ZYX-F-203]